MADTLIYAGCETIQPEGAIQSAGTIKLELPNVLVKADSLAYIIFAKHDLKKQRAFLEDFGMLTIHCSDNTLYMRGVSETPYIYVAYQVANLDTKIGQGPRNSKGYLGMGFTFQHRSELEALSKETNIPITDIDGPGGGFKVRLIDPDGFIADAVWGRENVARIQSQTPDNKVNSPTQKARVNKTVRPPLIPSPIEKFGHCVLSVSNYKKSLSWYVHYFGLIPTDVQCLKDGTPALSFNRLNRGTQPADHHSLVLIQNIYPRYMHSAYETTDLDSLGQGQQFMHKQGWKHFWGIGRHILGSQLFDYWLDPEGEELEHYTDGDVFDESFTTQYHYLDIGGLWAWGHDVPNEMKPKLSFKEIWMALKAIRKGNLTLKELKLMKLSMGSKARPWLK